MNSPRLQDAVLTHAHLSERFQHPVPPVAQCLCVSNGDFLCRFKNGVNQRPWNYLENRISKGDSAGCITSYYLHVVAKRIALAVGDSSLYLDANADVVFKVVTKRLSRLIPSSVRLRCV